MEENSKKPKGYWLVYENCALEVSKFTKLTEFREERKHLYETINKKGWNHLFDEIRERDLIPSNSWTIELCTIEALKYTSKKKFKKGSRSAHIATDKNNWWDIVCAHMIHTSLPNGHWSYENCKEIALNCKTFSELRSKSRGALCAIKRKKWDDLTAHFVEIGSLIKRRIYVYEFSDNHVYVGLTGNHLKRNDNHYKRGPVFEHMKVSNSTPVYKFLTEYISAEEAKKEEGNFVDYYIQNGWFILNSAPTGALGGNIVKWTDELSRIEAAKYETKTEFHKNASSAYYIATENGWLNDVFENVKSKGREVIWTYEKTKEEALKYNKKSEFQIGACGAYYSAINNKWMKEFFPENKYRTTSWTYDKIKVVANKCKGRKEFKQKYPAAYEIARNTKFNETDELFWLDHLFASTTARRWTFEECKEIALNYNTKKELEKNNRKAYRAAERNNWLDILYPKK